MNVTCNDRDRIFEDGSPDEWAALEGHAAACARCAEEIRGWKSLSVAARELRDYSDGPSFWPRIARALAEEASSGRRDWFSFLPSFSSTWQTALAGAFVVVLAIAGGWVHFHPPVAKVQHDNSLLRSSALQEVESAETEYEHAIGKLAAEARPQLDNPATPLLANYHEKLLVLDTAIADLRAQTGMNPSNAQLRYQLLAMYQEKQHTLREVLEARP
jgi:hypothetical protein